MWRRTGRTWALPGGLDGSQGAAGGDQRPGAAGDGPAGDQGKRGRADPAGRGIEAAACCPRIPMTRKTSSWRSAAAPAGRRRPSSPIPCIGCTTMYAEKKGLEDARSSPSMRPSWAASRRSVFTVDGEGAYSRLKYESGVHRVQRVPETETQGTDPHLHRHGGGSAGGGGGGAGDRPEGSADRHLPLQRRRRPAHQQNLLCHPDHPPAHRDGGGVPG